MDQDNAYNFFDAGMSGDQLDSFRDNVINTFLTNASAVINKETDPDKKKKMEDALEGRVSQINAAFDKYGPAAFDPNLLPQNQNPKDSSLDVPNYMPSNVTGDLPNSPLKANGLLAPKEPEQASWADTLLRTGTSLGSGLLKQIGSISNLTSNPLNEALVKQAIINSPDLTDAQKHQALQQASDAANPVKPLYEAADQYSTPAPNEQESFAQELTRRGIPLVGQLAEAGLGGGAAEIPEAANLAAKAVPFAGKYLANALRAAPTAGVLSAEQAAELPDTMSPEQKALAASQGLGTNLALGGLPMALGASKATRVATGGLLGGGISAGLDKLQGNDVDPVNAALGAITGAGLQALHPSEAGYTPQTPKVEDAVLSDPDIAAGVQAGKEATSQINPVVYKDATTIYSGRPEKAPVPSTNIPYPSWKNIEQPPADVSVDTTSSIQKNNEIERAYQQKAADEKAVRNLVPDILDELSPQKPAEDATVADLSQGQPAPNQVLGSNPDLQQLADTLKVRQAVRTAQMPEPGAEVTNIPAPIDTSGAPGRTRTTLRAQPSPAQFKLKLGDQEQVPLDLTGKAPVESQAEAPQTPTPATASLSKDQLLSSLKDKLAAKTGTAPAELPSKIGYSQDEYSAGLKHLSNNLADSISKGTATADHVIDSFANNEGNRVSSYPEFQALAQAAQKIRDTLGGGNAKIEVIPKDPNARTAEQKAWIDSYNKKAAARGNPIWGSDNGAAGVYSEATHTIKINGLENATPATLLHESVHPLTNAVLTAGENGELTGDRLQGYKNLKSIFEALKPELEKQTTDLATAYGKQKGDVRHAIMMNDKLGYGLKNLHEFASEAHSNLTFVKNLQRVDLQKLQDSAKGTSRWLPLRTALAKARNVYEAITGSIKKMLGLNDKAANAYDALQGHFHNFVESFKNAPEGERASDIFAKRRAAVERHLAAAKESPKIDTSNKDFTGSNDPLKRNRFVDNAKDILGRAFLGDRRTEFGRAIGTAKEEYTGAIAESLRETQAHVAELKAAMAKDKLANPNAVVDYIHGIHSDDPQQVKEANALLKGAPNTKALLDNKIIPLLQSKEHEIVKNIASMPNPTKQDLLLAHTILDNPGYTMRQYNTDSYSENILKSGLAGQKALAAGKEVSPEVQKAVSIVKNAQDFIDKEIMPNASVQNKNLSALRTQAKHLGIDTVKTLTGITGKSNKRAALIKAIYDAVPDVETAERTKQRVLLELAGLINNKKSPVSSYIRGARLGDITKVRKEVPQALRDLWGEMKDPANVLVGTLLKQDRAIAQYKQQNDIRNALMGKYAFDSKTQAPAYATEQLTGRQMGALRNMWVPPRVADMLQASLSLDTASKSLREAFMSSSPITNSYRWAANLMPRIVPKTIGRWKLFQYSTDPGYYLMFVAGNPSILMQNGVVDPRYFARGVAAKLGEMSPKLLASLKASSPELGSQIEQDVSHIIKSGFGDSMMAGEMYDQILADKIKEATASGAYRSSAEAIQHAMSKVASSVTNLGSKALSLTDSPARYASLLHRMDILSDHYKRLGIEKSVDDIRSEAADYVRDTTITHNRAPLFPQITERVGISRGAVYNIETVRNAFNSMTKGYGDLIEGIKTGDQIFAMHGFKQMVGSAGSVVYMGKMLAALGGASLGLVGMVSNAISPTDKRQKYLQQEGSFFAGERTEEIVDPNNPDGSTGTRFFWAPGDRNDYNYGLAQVVHNIQDAYEQHEAGQEIDVKQLAKNALGAFANSFMSSALSSKIMNIVNAKVPGWERNEAPQHLQEEMAFWQNELGLTPEGAKRMVAIMDIGTAGLYKNRLIAKEASASPAMKTLLSLGIGIKPIQADTGLVLPKGQSSTSTRTTNELATAQKVLTDTITSPSDISDEQIDKMYKKAFKDSYKALDKLGNAYEFAQANGIDESDLVANSVRGKISPNAVAATMYQDKNPAMLLLHSLSSAMTNELKTAKPEQYEDIVQRYAERQQHLLELTEKYSNLTPEQIKEL